MASDATDASAPSDSAEPPDSTEDPPDPTEPRLLSRSLVTWVELVVVGFAGTALGGVVSGPPRLVVYLATTLLTVGLLMYNVDRLVRARLAHPE